ncbi:MAG: MCE family protein [Alphaproteobacteria bacterium]|nr:MCE family protein [Alphaproteobacteria bacterium]
MKKSPIETVLGILVILVAVFFVHFAANKIDARPQQGYELTAVFTRSGGLESGNDIRISGIKVGSVVGLDLTPDYTAEVTMNIREGVRLPADTTAVVTTDGLMGGTFVQLEPGKSKEILKSGDRIAKTKDFRSLEDMVGEVIFLATGKED